MSSNNEPLYTEADSARYLGVSYNTIIFWVGRGWLNPKHRSEDGSMIFEKSELDKAAESRGIALPR